MPTHPPPPIPGYSALELIGEGGMGRVYSAYDDRHHRRVAIKLVHRDLSDPLAHARFEQEIRMAARLAHPNILPVFDSGRVDGRIYYVMPLFEGRSLRELLREQNTLDPTTVCRLGIDLADALAHAHARGVVHRDIKPDNVLLSGERAALADFGLARALDEAEVGAAPGRVASGTPGYMSPEQAAGLDGTDARADIYALGLTLLEALTGSPAGNPNSQAPRSGRLAVLTASARHRRRLLVVLRKAAAPNPAERFQSAREFVNALRTCQEDAAGKRAAVIAAVLATLLLASTLGALVWRGTRVTLVDSRVAVAVLENRSGRPDLDPLGAVAADWVVQGLQRAGGVEVVPTTASMTAARAAETSSELGSDADPAAVLSRATGARYVITGSYSIIGDSLRIHAELSDALRGTLVGALDPVSTRLDGTDYALDELRSRIIAMLARHLDARAASGPGATARPPTLASYEHFLRGLDAYSRTRWTEAAEHLRAASAEDPGFVQAELYEALSLSNLGRFAAADSLLTRVGQRSALLSEYDRQWMEYRRTMMRGDRPAALRAIRRAAEIAPTSKASYNLAVELMEQGRPAEALAALEPLEAAAGAMSGFVPYPATIAVLNHLIGAHRRELAAVERMLHDFPEERWGRVLEMNALAALGREDAVLERFERYLRDARGGAGTHPLDAAIQVADELYRHGRPQTAAQLLELAQPERGLPVAPNPPCLPRQP